MELELGSFQKNQKLVELELEIFSKNGRSVKLHLENPATSWFEVVELPLVRWLKTITVNGEESSIVEEIFNKTFERIAW